jgi:hypothetical protein
MPFLKILIPVGVNRIHGIHEYPSEQAYSETLCFHMAEQCYLLSIALIELFNGRVIVTDNSVEIRHVIPTAPRGEHIRFVICVLTTLRAKIRIRVPRWLMRIST